MSEDELLDDPDYWIKIPAFGVNPRDVNFAGFKLPIWAPNPKSHELMHLIREQVKTARTLMRKGGHSLFKIEKDFGEAIDIIYPQPGAEKRNTSPSQDLAIIYISIMDNAEKALWHGTIGTQKSLKLCYQAISQCTQGIRKLILLGSKGEEKSFEVEIPETVARHSASKQRILSEAGKLGASAKHKLTRELKDWALKKAVGMHSSDREIARKLYRQLPPHLANVSDDPMRLIYDTLRASQKGQLHVTAGLLGVTAAQPSVKVDI